MKLLKRPTQTYKGTKYYSWTVIVPAKFVREVGWDEGIELDVEILDYRNNSAILKPKK